MWCTWNHGFNSQNKKRKQKKLIKKKTAGKQEKKRLVLENGVHGMLIGRT